MKRMSFALGLAVVAAGATLPAATVSVSSFRGTVYGPGEATLAFTDVDAAQELWVAWDDADKGADISQWKESERLDTIASGTTSATNRLPDDARLGRAARFFLLPDGGAASAASDPLDLTTARSEDVFADAYIWMRGMAVDTNSNHVLDVGEITNSLNTVALTTGSYGAAGHKPVISNEFVRLPGRGVGRQMQTLYFPQDVVWTNETQTLGYVTPCAVTCGTPLKDFDSHYTWIIRFRPDFSEPVLDTQCLLGFGYYSKSGMMFGLAETSTERRKLQVHTYNSSWDLGESFVISNGCGWVDFAVTVDGQKVTAYLMKDGPTTPDGNTDIGLLKRESRTYENSVNLVPSSGGYLRFGTESPQNGTYAMPAPSSGNNHYKTFRGSIQQFACWKRTLSEQEILAALGWPRAETWRVGVENDATTELSADTAPEGGFDVDGELWPVPNGGLTNGVSVTFKFPIEAGYDDGRAQIFRWKATSDSAAGRLGVAVNGKSLGKRSIKAGETQSWVVPAAVLIVGTNTLTVTRIDSGTGVVTLDAAAFGGGWQVGRRDDDWTDFGHEGAVSNDYHVVDGNMRHVPRAMLYAGDGNHTKSRELWHAVMPRSLAGEYDWILHFRTGPEGGGAGTRLCIDLNGERLATKDAPGTKTDHPFAISRELLKAGENVFSFLNDTQSGTDFISIDSVWLEPVALPIYTLTWGEGFDSVSFTTNGVAGAALVAADGEYRFQAPEGLEVVLTGDTGYRTIEVSSTGSSSAISLEGVSGIAKYFPQTATANQDGSAENPYEIADADDLQVLKAAFAADASCRSLNYKVVADIDATDLGYWDGIGAQGTANSGLNGGTLDGDGHTISNLMFSTGTYRAFFNRMDNATIKNLTIHVKDIQETDAEEHGYAAFVGNLQNSVLQNCVATGTIGTVAKPSMHISAGFAATVGSGGVFVDCTNHISIVCAQTANPKIGGIVGHLQGGVLTNCWNDGDITIAVKGSKDADNGAGGLIGYAQSNSATIYHCGNAGTVQSTSDFASHANDIPINVGTIIGRQKSSATTVAGDTIAQADAAPAGARSNVGGAAGIFFGLIYGLDFAIVDDNVATFVSSLAAGNTYKVMLSGATATFAFTEPGTISFDEAMYTPTYAITAAQGLTLTDTTVGTVKTYTATATPETWIGGAQGDWETASNWNGGFVPTKDTVVTFTNDAQVAIGDYDRCKELVLSNANVTLVRAANATEPILYFYGNGNSAVSVASGATGSLGVNNLALFNERKDETDLTIGCAFEILGDVTFRGISIIDESLSASFTITCKTTISADAIVKTIDYGTTKFQGGIEVAKGVTAKVNTTAHGGAQIGTGVTLVVNDGEGAPTTIWLMRSEHNSRGVSLVNGARVSVDAVHAGDCFPKKDTDLLDYINCDVYEACWNPTVFVTTYDVTVAGVENGQRVIPGTDLIINVSGFAEGYVPSVTIMKHEDYSVLLTTNAVSFTYTMLDFDIDVVADATPPSYNDPEGYKIEDPVIIGWLAGNGFTQGDIDALGNDTEATDKLYECYLLNCSIKAANPGGALTNTAIAVTNGVVSITVQLVRQKPLGFINGVLHIYGTDDLADDFSLISDEIVYFSDGDSIFDTEQTEGPVTQSVTATFSPADVSAKFFKAVIEFPIPGDPDPGEEPWEEPEPDPEE